MYKGKNKTCDNVECIFMAIGCASFLMAVVISAARDCKQGRASENIGPMSVAIQVPEDLTSSS
jgi:hypothetical protein